MKIRHFYIFLLLFGCGDPPQQAPQKEPSMAFPADSAGQVAMSRQSQPAADTIGLEEFAKRPFGAPLSVASVQSQWGKNMNLQKIPQTIESDTIYQYTNAQDTLGIYKSPGRETLCRAVLQSGQVQLRNGIAPGMDRQQFLYIFKELSDYTGSEESIEVMAREDMFAYVLSFSPGSIELRNSIETVYYQFDFQDNKLKKISLRLKIPPAGNSF